MKTVILAGGEPFQDADGIIKPKAMGLINGKPIIYYLMDYLSHHSLNDFIICTGFGDNLIKDFFCNLFLNTSDVDINFEKNKISFLQSNLPKWTVKIINTSKNSMTGGRLKAISNYLDEDNFCVTYGNCLADVDVEKLLSFHTQHHQKATITVVNARQKYGIVDRDFNGNVLKFRSQSENCDSLINLGFMILNKEVIDLISDSNVVLEKYPLEELARQGELNSFIHSGFWKFADNQKDLEYLENLELNGRAPWRKEN